jgi:hypothetical protein
VSAARTSALLVRLYPPGWRARYGEELEALIVEASDGRRVPWRVRLDVLRAAGRARLNAAGLGPDGGPAERVRGGALLTLCAWALFVVAGSAVQKISEHWQDATPAGSRDLPAVAFGALVVAAVCASVLVVAGIAAAAPSLAAFLRTGGWPAIRPWVRRATALTVLLVVGTIGLIAWAHGLNGPERNGGDSAYTVAFACWAALAVACLLAWTAAAVATARRLDLPAPALRAQAWVSASVAAAMAVMTAATVIWWVALADAAPWFLAGKPAGTSASALAPELLAAAALMVLATLLGAAGALQAMRARAALPGPRA